tara:strand:+ start:784 stop:990 length:207 start_codon:yes stop_codon:yes gene_type:complete
MRDMVYIVGLTVGVGMAFTMGMVEGAKSIPVPKPVPVPLSVTEMENKCVAWFFNADLKAAKKHMCGGK